MTTRSVVTRYKASVQGVDVLIDIYALSSERTAAAVERFLTRYLPNREQAGADYSVTLGDDHPAAVLDTPEELARFCEAHPEAEGRAYWTNQTAVDPHSAHVFFLPAGGMVFGLSLAAQDQLVWDRWLADLLAFAGSANGYWIGECPPENTVHEFVAVAQRHAERGTVSDWRGK